MRLFLTALMALCKKAPFCIFRRFICGTGQTDKGERNAANMKKIRFLTTAAVIAALYAALTYVFSFMSYGQVQFRVAEILTVLPFYTPAAIPGLALGCVLSNITSPLGPIDMLVGGAASLLAATLSRVMPKKLVPIPPIICNAVIVGLELHFVYNTPTVLNMLWVAIGEAVVCLAGGYVFMFALDRLGGRVFDPKQVGSKRLFH
jgi:uncharacterized membrane protein